MTVPHVVAERVDILAAELRVPLQIKRHWENDSGPGHYCRVHGVMHESPLLTVELVGSLAIGTRADEMDLFILVNGVRLSPINNQFAYLYRPQDGDFRWDDLDPGYEEQTTLDRLLLRKS